MGKEVGGGVAIYIQLCSWGAYARCAHGCDPKEGGYLQRQLLPAIDYQVHGMINKETQDILID